MNLKEKAYEIKKSISALFIAIKMKETPWYAKVISIITVWYALSPIDLIPDFIPVLGYLDDIIILPILILLSIKLIPKEIMDEAHLRSEEIWKDGKPKAWYYAIPILFIWVMIIILVLKIIF